MEKNSGTDLIDNDHILGYFHFFSFTSNFYKWFCSLFLKLWMCVLGVCVCWVCVCPALCGLMDRSPPGSSVYGIFQARILEWAAISYSNCSSHISSGSNLHLCVSRTGRWILYHHTPWEALKLSMGATISKIRWTQQFEYSYQPPDPSS